MYSHHKLLLNLGFQSLMKHLNVSIYIIQIQFPYTHSLSSVGNLRDIHGTEIYISTCKFFSTVYTVKINLRECLFTTSWFIVDFVWCVHFALMVSISSTVERADSPFFLHFSYGMMRCCRSILSWGWALRSKALWEMELIIWWRIFSSVMWVHFSEGPSQLSQGVLVLFSISGFLIHWNLSTMVERGPFWWFTPSPQSKLLKRN